MIFIRGARQLVTLRGPSPRRGIQLADLGVIPDGAVLIDGGRIREVGTTRRIENLAAARSAEVIDAGRKVVLPGFVDCFTRLVTPGSLAYPFVQRMAGALETRPAPAPPIRSASPKGLRQSAKGWTALLASHGTTALEVRSGPGLELQSELKTLRAARAVNDDPLEVACAFSAAPKESDEPGATASDVEQVTEVLLPIIRRRRLTTLCAVECGPRSFDGAQARAIVDAARAQGFRVRLGGETHRHWGLAALAVENDVLTVEHLQYIAEREIGPLAASSTIATLLPAFVHAGGADRYAPARDLVDRGVAIALATGFGADSPTLSMPMVLSLACREMKLSPEEAITAATINGAAAMGEARRYGSLEPGKQADLAIFDVQDYREIPYYFGFNLCVMTMKKGRVIYRAGPE